MAVKKNLKSNTATKTVKVSREVRRMRTMNIIFLVICMIVIFSMIVMAVGKF